MDTVDCPTLFGSIMEPVRVPGAELVVDPMFPLETTLVGAERAFEIGFVVGLGVFMVRTVPIGAGDPFASCGKVCLGWRKD